jgi:ribosome modulation factor
MISEAIADAIDANLSPAFYEGMNARMAGRALSACPYALGDPQRCDWEEGWDTMRDAQDVA